MSINKDMYPTIIVVIICISFYAGALYTINTYFPTDENNQTKVYKTICEWSVDYPHRKDYTSSIIISQTEEQQQDLIKLFETSCNIHTDFCQYGIHKDINDGILPVHIKSYEYRLPIDSNNTTYLTCICE